MYKEDHSMEYMVVFEEKIQADCLTKDEAFDISKSICDSTGCPVGIYSSKDGIYFNLYAKIY